jgi:hypothetical protein
MFPHSMLFRSLKNLFLCVTCHGVRAIKSYLTAFQFVHLSDTCRFLQGSSYKSSEIIFCQRFRQSSYQLMRLHIPLIHFDQHILVLQIVQK